MTTLAATASVAAYSLYRMYALKRKLASREDVYETAKSLNEYLIFHYGSPDEVLTWSFGPKSDVDFPKRCAELCVKHAAVKVFTAYARFIVTCPQVHLSAQLEPLNPTLTLTLTFGMACNCGQLNLRTREKVSVASL